MLAGSHLRANEVATPFDPKAESIKIEERENWVHISLQTQTMAGQRLICAWPESLYGKREVYLDYCFIQNMAASYRHMEPVTVTWKIMKTDWVKWQEENAIFVRKKDDVKLAPEQIKIIKEDWEP